MRNSPNRPQTAPSPRNSSDAGGAPEATAAEEASPEAIREQLQRILTSPEFAVPERARKFLKYLIDETLAGRSDRIKAYSIAIEVFGRNESFDAQNDPAVRIEAGRIRRALERYYLVAGQSDPLVIGIPKGGYVPQFVMRSAVTAPQKAAPQAGGGAPAIPTVSFWRRRRWLASIAAALLLCVAAIAAWRTGNTPTPSQALLDDYVPRVVVTPFSDLGSDANSKTYAAGLTAEIVDRLVKFKDIVVIADAPTPSATLEATTALSSN